MIARPARKVEIKLDRPISRPDGVRTFGKSAVLIIEGGDGGKLEKVTFDGNNGKVELIKQDYPDGPVAVAPVGAPAYVCESQMSAMGGRGRPGAAAAPPPLLKPFKAAAVEVGKPDFRPPRVASGGRFRPPASAPRQTPRWRR